MIITSTTLGALGEVNWSDQIRMHLPDSNPIEDPELDENATFVDGVRHPRVLQTPI